MLRSETCGHCRKSSCERSPIPGGSLGDLQGLIDCVVLFLGKGRLRVELRGSLAAMLTARKRRKGRQKLATFTCRLNFWLRGGDLNPRPLGYEPNELPDCSTPRHENV